jgi:hypothetical protein
MCGFFAVTMRQNAHTIPSNRYMALMRPCTRHPRLLLEIFWSDACALTSHYQSGYNHFTFIRCVDSIFVHVSSWLNDILVRSTRMNSNMLKL